jgi:hypothetical protein
MSADQDHYRREAERIEQMAKQISLLPDREDLLAKAESLRRLADQIEALSACFDADWSNGFAAPA